MNDKVLMCIVASLLAAPVGVSANKVANDVLAVQKAQQTIYQIKGMVTDSNGDPLPGVTVSVKSIDRICLTDINGRYALPVPKNGVYELEFRMIGMRMVSHRITVHGSTQMKTIQLDDDISELNEVVVTGYGNIKKGAHPGSE